MAGVALELEPIQQKAREISEGYGHYFLGSIVISHKRGQRFVVDGQQRLSALATMEKPGFQVFVSALICKDYNELRQQFVLVNNTRPLPKSLIYELLPTVYGLPERFTSRKFAARIIDLLNCNFFI